MDVPELQFVGNKTKGWISKRVLQENKACQIFWKTSISYPPRNLISFQIIPLKIIVFLADEK